MWLSGWAALNPLTASQYRLKPLLDFVARPPCPFIVWSTILRNPCWILWLSHPTLWPFELLFFTTIVGSVGFCGWSAIPADRVSRYLLPPFLDFWVSAALTFHRLSCYLLQPWLDFAAEPLYPLFFWAPIYCNPDWILRLNHYLYPLIFWAAIYCHLDFILRLNHYTHFFLGLYLLQPLLKVWLSQTTLWPCEPLSFATLAGLCSLAMVPFHHLIIWTTIFCNSSGLCGWTTVQYPDRLPHYLWQPFLDLVATTLWPFAPLSFAPLFDLFGSCGWATLPFAHLSRYLLQPLLNFVAEPQYPQIIWATSVSFVSVIGCDVWATPHFVENYILPGLGRVRVPSLLANVYIYIYISYICTYSLYNNRLNFELFESSPL